MAISPNLAQPKFYLFHKTQQDLPQHYTLSPLLLLLCSSYTLGESTWMRKRNTGYRVNFTETWVCNHPFSSHIISISSFPQWTKRSLPPRNYSEEWVQYHGQCVSLVFSLYSLLSSPSHRSPPTRELMQLYPCGVSSIQVKSLSPSLVVSQGSPMLGGPHTPYVQNQA